MGKSMNINRPENNDYTVKDQGLDSVTEEIMHKKPNHTMKLYEIDYLYAYSGLHRKLELEFNCCECIYQCYVLMDKTSDGHKNIRIEHCKGSSKLWWIWTYRPDYFVSYDTCISLFKDAPTGYNLLTNNCSHFAKYIWDRI